MFEFLLVSIYFGAFLLGRIGGKYSEVGCLIALLVLITGLLTLLVSVFITIQALHYFGLLLVFLALFYIIMWGFGTTWGPI